MQCCSGSDNFLDARTAFNFVRLCTPGSKQLLV